MKKKPSPQTIRDTRPLTADRLELEDPMAGCSVCGNGSDGFDLWREHDERDRPIDGLAALVFLGRGDDHKKCRTVLDRHPRLYAQERGMPGHFPLLCGPCTFRAPNGLACTHPDLKSNGGAGLRVSKGPWAGTIICAGRGRGGCSRPFDIFTRCAGRTLPVAPGGTP